MAKAGRWAGDLAGSKLQPQHWRLSDTWFALTRRHAEVIAQEADIEREFANNCAHSDADPAGRALFLKPL